MKSLNAFLEHHKKISNINVWVNTLLTSISKDSGQSYSIAMM